MYSVKPSPPTELFINIDNEVDNAIEDENIPLKPITLDEVKEDLKDLANNKAAGPDLISAELLKYGSKAMCCKLTSIVNFVWQSNKVPDEWKRSATVKLLERHHVVSNNSKTCMSDCAQETAVSCL